MGFLFKLLKKQKVHYKGFLVFFLLMSFVVVIASVAMTRLTGDIGQAVLEIDTSVLFRLFMVITAIMLLRVAASAASALVLMRFAGKAGYSFRDNFVKYFLHKPFAAYDDAKSGETLSVFSNDLPYAVSFVANSGIRMIADVISLLVTFAYLFYLGWWLTLIFIAMFPVLVIMQLLIAAPIQKKSEVRNKARANATTVANDAFQNTGVVISYSLEKVMKERFRMSLEDWINTNKDLERTGALLVTAGFVTSASPILVIIAVSAYRVIGGNMSIAEWIAYITLAREAGTWLMMLSQRQNEVRTSKAGATRMDEHLEGETESITAGNALIPSGDINVSAVNLKFVYGKEAESPLALNNVSFEIKQGARVAFVGGSGSGKSTVLKLLLGLYAPQEGKILVNGEDTSSVSLQSLRDIYAYVPQDSFLFPESILWNITGESDISDKLKLEKVCHDAGILEFIQSLPDGFYSTLNEAAENVSGGQKQRIALARALYRDSPVILFDEATSALDPVTEAAILQNFNKVAKNKTVVMIAHRLSAIEFCDTIIVMENGKIAALGAHDELIDTSPIYANLYEAQQKEAVA
jgi:ABC-type bacteriocin/lantibiotic exporter with double-glycine peptidase domain